MKSTSQGISRQVASVAIGLGANVPSQAGDPADTIRTAIKQLEAQPWAYNVSASSILTTPPLGPQDQPDYANAAVVFETPLDPRALMRHLLRLETHFGRDRAQEERWGPRTLDLDLLLYGDTIMNEPFITIPHPRMHERTFVLEPLMQLCPDRIVAGLDRSIRDLLAGLASS